MGACCSFHVESPPKNSVISPTLSSKCCESGFQSRTQLIIPTGSDTEEHLAILELPSPAHCHLAVEPASNVGSTIFPRPRVSFPSNSDAVVETCVVLDDASNHSTSRVESLIKAIIVEDLTVIEVDTTTALLDEEDGTFTPIMGPTAVRMLHFAPSAAEERHTPHRSHDHQTLGVDNPNGCSLRSTLTALDDDGDTHQCTWRLVDAFTSPNGAADGMIATVLTVSGSVSSRHLTTFPIGYQLDLSEDSREEPSRVATIAVTGSNPLCLRSPNKSAPDHDHSQTSSCLSSRGYKQHDGTLEAPNLVSCDPVTTNDWLE